MFGLCILDRERQVFSIARDRVGIKPVYLARVDDGLLLVASEMRSILESGLVPREFNHEALPWHLTLGSVPAPWTLARGIEKLRPAEIRRIDLGSSKAVITSRQYWTVPFRDSIGVTAKDEPERIQELKVAFTEAASNHLLSDVPLGVFLSGGIDSGSIVEAVSRQHSNVQTFAIAFSEAEYDESAVAAATAKKFGTQHQTLVLTPEEMLKHMQEAFDAYDSPSFDGVNTWLISRAVRGAGIKVALSGLGGDEVFAGYSYHRMMKRLQNRIFRSIASLYARSAKVAGKGSIRTTKLALAASTDRPVDHYLALRRVLAPEIAGRLLPGSPMTGLPQSDYLECTAAIAGLDPVNAYSLLDMRCYMLNTILQDADQMSMAHGLELRVPFLDHRVVEAAARIPGQVKTRQVDGHRNKSLLLRLLERPLPDECVTRRKSGFVFPWDRWLRKELKEFATAGMESTRAIAATGMSHPAVLEVSRSFQAGDPQVRSTDILCMLTLLNWVERVILRSVDNQAQTQLTSPYFSKPLIDAC